MASLIQLLVWSALALATGVGAGPIRDIDGRAMSLFKASQTANVLLFVTSDCPISNGYAPDIQRLCAEYKARGVSCSLLYEDATIEAAAVRKHLADYRYRGIAVAIDDGAAVARQVNATVTPQAVVIDAKGDVRYRGRIDNRYVDLGKSRRVVTDHDLRDALDAVIAGRPVANVETTPVGCFIASR
jgi:hypothetical protein